MFYWIQSEDYQILQVFSWLFFNKYMCYTTEYIKFNKSYSLRTFLASATVTALRESLRETFDLFSPFVFRVLPIKGQKHKKLGILRRTTHNIPVMQEYSCNHYAGSIFLNVVLATKPWLAHSFNILAFFFLQLLSPLKKFPLIILFKFSKLISLSLHFFFTSPLSFSLLVNEWNLLKLHLN